MTTIDRHKRAISYGEIPPSFERPLTTTNRLPDDYRTDAQVLDDMFETELRKVFIPRGLVR